MGVSATTLAAEIKVLSAGAVEARPTRICPDREARNGHDLKIQFNTAPQIAKRLAAGEVYDILISPPAAIEQAVKDGKVVADGRVPVGRVGGGIIVRTAAAAPNVASRRIQARAARRRLGGL
jgi:molybdate transport system substrate-binding protein